MKKILIILALVGAIMAISGQRAMAQATLPDLSLNNYLIFEPAPTSWNSTDYKFTFQLNNSGSANFNGSVSHAMQYTVRDSAGNLKSQISWYPTVSVPAGQSIFDSHRLPRNQLTAGDTLTLAFDPFNTVSEVSETNNSRTFTVTQAMLDMGTVRPDLAFNDCLVFSASILPDSYLLTFSATNVGSAYLSNIYTVRYVIRTSGGVIKNDGVWYPNMAVGVGQTANLKLILPRANISAGDSITLHFDPENRINEASESNNSRAFIVTQAMINAGGGSNPFSQYVLTPKSTPAAIDLWNSLAGQVLLKTQAGGEVYYLCPRTRKVYFLKDASVAYYMMGNAGWGINEPDYVTLVGSSAEGSKMRDRLEGNVMLRVHARGEASYINPADLSVSYMQNGEAALSIMRSKGTGISNANLSILID